MPLAVSLMSFCLIASVFNLVLSFFPALNYRKMQYGQREMGCFFPIRFKLVQIKTVSFKLVLLSVARAIC